LLYRDQLASWKPDSKAIISLDLKTGQPTPLLRGTDVAVDRRTGVLYGQGGYGSNAVLRFDSDGNPLPFAGTEK